MTKVIRNTLAVMAVLLSGAAPSVAQTYSNHINIGTGYLFSRGIEVNLAFEHETKYHKAWEYFGNYYFQYADDPRAGHITSKTFWNNYRVIEGGVAYKPCVVRARNSHGNMRIGAGLGGKFETDEYDNESSGFVYCIHAGYEHDYNLRHGWQLYWQLKADLTFRGKDAFRGGIGLGLKIPTDRR